MGLIDRIFGKKTNSANVIRVNASASFVKPNSTIIENSTIILENNSQLILDENVIIKNYAIHVKQGVVKIGKETRLTGINNQVSLYIENGTLTISDHSIIQAEFCIRYGGQCSIGSYTGIMSGTEIRCDEKLSIGSFNMISYECMIYDTNTHVTYAKDVRREKTRKSFPNIGAEVEKPATSPVSIGDDCWLGKRAVVLKGVSIGDECTIATNAVVTKSCASNHLAYGNPAVFNLK